MDTDSTTMNLAGDDGVSLAGELASDVITHIESMITEGNSIGGVAERRAAVVRVIASDLYTYAEALD